MKITKRKNNTTFIAFGIVALIHLLIGWYFWDKVDIQELVDTLMRSTEVQQAPPPPPPPPPPPRIEVIKPEKPPVEFKVENPLENASKLPEFDLNFDMDMDVGADMEGFAMGEGLSTEDVNVSLELVSASITGVLGMSDITMKPTAARNRTRIIGKGRRMSGVIPATFLATDPDNKDDVKGKWDYLWKVDYSPMEAVQKYFIEETNLRLNEKTKTVDISSQATLKKVNERAAEQKYDFDQQFINLVRKSQGKAVPEEITSYSIEPELVALERIRALSSTIYNQDFGLNMEHIALLELIMNEYHRKKYDVKDLSLDHPKKLIEKVVKEQRQELRKWRQDGIMRLSRFLASKRGTQLTQADLEIPYVYLKMAEILLNPVVFSQPFYGIKVSDSTNHKILVNYIRNGGVFYLTDPTTDQGNISRNRSFVRNLILELEGEIIADETAKKSFEKLRDSDRKIPGYRFMETRTKHPHPFMPLEFEIPTQENVVIEAFNKHGQKVKTIVDAVLPANAYTYNRRKHVVWDATDEEGQDLASGVYFVQMTAGLFRQTLERHIPRLRRVKEQKHPLFSSYYNLGAIPTAFQDPQNLRAYDEYGVHAYEYRYKGRLAVFYSEGYAELHGFGRARTTDNAEQRAFWARNSSRWMANFFAYVLSQEGGVVQWGG